MEDNVQYCKKDDDYGEYGELPTVSGSTDKYKDVVSLAKRGDVYAIKSLYPAILFCYKNTLESQVLCDQNELENSCGVCVDLWSS